MYNVWDRQKRFKETTNKTTIKDFGQCIFIEMFEKFQDSSGLYNYYIMTPTGKKNFMSETLSAESKQPAQHVPQNVEWFNLYSFYQIWSQSL